MAASSNRLKHFAPIRFGAILFAAIALASCKRTKTPDWNGPVATAVAEQPAAPPINKEFAAKTHGAGLRFITYNVENWLTMERFMDGKMVPGSPKPDKEKKAVIMLLARNAPEVIGLCEIGSAEDLAEIRQDLKQAGLDLPHSHYTGGSDPTRHLGLLSRYPIQSTAKPVETEYQLNGRVFGINRGVLDATIDAHGETYRFIGVHLKSKRDSEQGDQDEIRLNEARLLRRHIDSIFKSSPDARLVVYGDFNDTRSTPVIKLVAGSYNDPTYLTAIPAKDSHGEAWTHFWALNDVYSRFDFVMVSKAMRKETDFDHSKIIDDREWSDASDHRPVLAIFK